MKLSILGIAIVLVISSCTHSGDSPTEKSESEFNLALGQWSFHKELFNNTMNNFEFIEVADSLGFWGVEYVNQFFVDSLESTLYFESIRAYADSLNIKSASLLVDKAGELGSGDESERVKALVEHKRWIDIAKLLGCTTVRVNAHGNGKAEEVLERCSETISELAQYTESQGMYLLIENHGGISSNADWLLNLIQELSFEPVGIMLDAANWCYEREGGDIWNGKCIGEFDGLEGIDMLLPFAHSISIKGMEFDAEGNETTINYSEVFDLIRESSYDGYLAIEFEGEKYTSLEGVIKTMQLVKQP